MDGTCGICKGKFANFTINQKYCSDSCRAIANNLKASKKWENTSSNKNKSSRSSWAVVSTGVR